jgi:hypothetical protein
LGGCSLLTQRRQYKLLYMIKQQVMSAFRNEFNFVQDKFEIMDLLDNNSEMDYDTIDLLKLPTPDYNIVWHPGVYLFLGNNSVYRVGVSMTNSRARVMKHLDACTADNGYCIWDIDKYKDKSILLFNVKEKINSHWLLALETYFENEFKPLIRAKRIG